MSIYCYKVKGNQSSGIHAIGSESRASIESSTLITVNLGCGLVVEGGARVSLPRPYIVIKTFNLDSLSVDLRGGAKVSMSQGSTIMKSSGEANALVQGEGSTLEALILTP